MSSVSNVEAKKVPLREQSGLRGGRTLGDVPGRTAARC